SRLQAVQMKRRPWWAPSTRKNRLLSVWSAGITQLHQRSIYLAAIDRHTERQRGSDIVIMASPERINLLFRFFFGAAIFFLQDACQFLRAAINLSHVIVS